MQCIFSQIHSKFDCLVWECYFLKQSAEGPEGLGFYMSAPVENLNCKRS